MVAATSEPTSPQVTTSPTVPEAQESPSTSQARGCEALQPQSGTQQVPVGAISVTMCAAATRSGMRPPVRPLTTGVDDLTTWINARPLFDARNRACTQELGPAYNLVFSYSDGRRVVVRAELYG